MATTIPSVDKFNIVKSDSMISNIIKLKKNEAIEKLNLNQKVFIFFN
jgi:hypothetical protein